MKVLVFAITAAVAGLCFSTAQPAQGADPDPKLTGVYELCAMELSNGIVLGSKTEDCADASPKNGIRVKDVLIQSCELPAKTKAGAEYCFTYRSSEHGTSIAYTVRLR